MKKTAYMCLITALSISNVNSAKPNIQNPYSTNRPTQMSTPQQPPLPVVTGYVPFYVHVTKQNGAPNLCLRFFKMKVSLSEVVTVPPIPISQSGIASLTAISTATHQSSTTTAAKSTTTARQSTLPSFKELSSPPPRITVPPLVPIRSTTPTQITFSSIPRRTTVPPLAPIQSTISAKTAFSSIAQASTTPHIFPSTVPPTAVPHPRASILSNLPPVTPQSSGTSSTNSKTTNSASQTSFEARLKSTEDSRKAAKKALRKMTVGWDVIPDEKQYVSTWERISAFNGYSMGTQSKTVEWAQLPIWLNRVPEIKRDIYARILEDGYAFLWWKGCGLQNVIWKINIAIIHPRIIPLLDRLEPDIRAHFISKICAYDSQYCDIKNDIPDTGKCPGMKTKYKIELKSPFPPIVSDWEIDFENDKLIEDARELKKQIESITINDWKECSQSLHETEEKETTIPAIDHIPPAKKICPDADAEDKLLNPTV